MDSNSTPTGGSSDWSSWLRSHGWLLGISAAGVVGVGGGLAWWWRRHRARQHREQQTERRRQRQQRRQQGEGIGLAPSAPPSIDVSRAEGMALGEGLGPRHVARHGSTLSTASATSVYPPPPLHISRSATPMIGPPVPVGGTWEASWGGLGEGGAGGGGGGVPSRSRTTAPPSPRLADLRTTEGSEQLSDTLLRAKMRKEARKDRLSGGAGVSNSESQLNLSTASAQPGLLSTPSPRQSTRSHHGGAAAAASTTATDSPATSSSTTIGSPVRTATGSSVVTITSPGPQHLRARLDTLRLRTPAGQARHAVEMLCLVVLLLVVLVLMQDARWLAPISPILIYSLFTVAKEQSQLVPEEPHPRLTPGAAGASAGAGAGASSSVISTPSRARLSLRDPSHSAPTQAISLLGMSIRIPTSAAAATPARHIHTREAQLPPISATREQRRHETAGAALGTPAATPVAARGPTHPRPTVGAVPAPSPILATISGSPSLRTPLAAPQPASAVRPAAIDMLLRSELDLGESVQAAPALRSQPSPMQRVRQLESERERVATVVQPPRKSPSVAAAEEHKSREDEDMQQPAVLPASQSEEQQPARHIMISARDAHSNRNNNASEPNRAAAGMPSPKIIPPSPVIASAQQQHDINVAAALSRIAPSLTPTPAVASSTDEKAAATGAAPAASGSMFSPEPSLQDSSVPGSTSADSLTPREEEFFRPALVNSTVQLPNTAATTTSFTLRFTLHHSFESVVGALLKLGPQPASLLSEEADDTLEDSDTNSNPHVTPPLTPSMMTPNTSFHSLQQQQQLAAHPLNNNFLSPIPVSFTSPQPHGVGAGAPGSAASSSSSSALLFPLNELLVDTLEETVVPESDGRQITFLVRRVSTPIKLPTVLRKLLGSVRRLGVEERLVVDPVYRRARVQVASRDLSQWLSLYSLQALAPHPTNNQFTLWTCKYKLTVYSSCGILRPNVVNWLSTTAKQRQQQISLFLSAELKRQLRIAQREREREKQREEDEARASLMYMSGSGLKRRGKQKSVQMQLTPRNLQF